MKLLQRLAPLALLAVPLLASAQPSVSIYNWTDYIAPDTLAGFEGATKINVNTISPWDVRDRVLARLRELRAAGALADGMRIGADARVRPGALRYADGAARLTPPRGR